MHPAVQVHPAYVWTNRYSEKWILDAPRLLPWEDRNGASSVANRWWESTVDNQLNQNSVMECQRHGQRRPAFICQHLQFGAGLGFYQPDDPPAPDWPFYEAWCADCELVLRAEGEWNERSESIAGVMAICEGCFEEIKHRNLGEDK